MNAAFLLVTTACLVGQPAAQPAPAPAAAPAAAAACGAGGGCKDPCGCDGFGHRLRDRLQGLFQHDCRDNSKPTTCCNIGHAWQNRAPLFNWHNSCDDCGRAKLWNWQPFCRTQNNCAPANTCSDPCDRGNFLGRLRGIFHRNNDCCNTTGAAGAPAGGTEKVDAPKKMPADKKPAPPVTPKSEVSIESSRNAVPPIVTPQAAIPAVPAIPEASDARRPVIEVQPANPPVSIPRDPF